MCLLALFTILCTRSHVLSASFELDQKYSTPLVTSQRVPQPVTTAADDAPLKAQPGKAVEKPRRTTDSGVQSQGKTKSLVNYALMLVYFSRNGYHFDCEQIHLKHRMS